MTFVGLVLVLALVGFVALVVIKTLPIYIESMKVDAALASIMGESGIEQASVPEIRKKFARRMSIDQVDRFTESNVKDYMEVVKDGSNLAITVSYEARAELFGNLSLVADFEKQVSKP
jgi:hypothetical protein